MSDRMRPMPFRQLLQWIIGEFRSQESIFGIPKSQFFFQKYPKEIQIFDETCAIPLGPAAGPHTQLAQNIVSAYLAGGRFFELKTVQRLDKLKFDKPCIDARDEGYNTEWSTELSLDQAFDEYIKAWILLYLLESIFKRSVTSEKSFIFNMSVGYDLDGIQTPDMDSFIHQLADASNHAVFKRHLEELQTFLREDHLLKEIATRETIKELVNLNEVISPYITRSVTLSTMHGCPPSEIEAISRYLMGEKGLHTYVKLNPTLLGYKEVRKILDTLGFDSISLKESVFDNDLQWDDAIRMLKRLSAFSGKFGRYFGIKLSNTLGVVNDMGILPGDEMYLSGRILFPITITLASRLARQFKGDLPISYSGGAFQFNIDRIFEAGIRPITMVTELLKPGGYLRMKEIAKKLEGTIQRKVSSQKIDAAKLEWLAEDALRNPYYCKDWRGTNRVSVNQTLPLTDCYIAPCILSCPILQDIPEYIQLAGKGKYDAALEIIYRKNPLPHITGNICTHPCMSHCTRLDYEGAVQIREVKRITAICGQYSTSVRNQPATKKLAARVAVIGAGPAGLSAAYFLSKAGFKVTIFEKRESPGGVVTHILPQFRISLSAVRNDIAEIEAMGTEFRYGFAEAFSISHLKNEGYQYIFIGIGAEVSQEFSLAGENRNVYQALEFLMMFNKDGESLNLGRKVAVIGGGNTAIDSARAALRVKGVEKVYIIYRRTEREMPADWEEYKQAINEGVIFKALLLPESFSRDGTLKCCRMKLGASDRSGRKSPVPTEEKIEIGVDSVITAIGEHADVKLLKNCGLEIEQSGRPRVNSETLETNIKNVFIGGDVLRGPSTVVEAIADARKAAGAIIKKEMTDWNGQEKPFKPGRNDQNWIQDIYHKKGCLILPEHSKEDKAITEIEASRCLECNMICNKCVDVCPNRANVAIKVDGKEDFKDIFQILHLDFLCNECGNCATFCPYNGKPYQDKLTLFATRVDFEDSSNHGFVITGCAGNQIVTLRYLDVLWEWKINEKNELEIPIECNNPAQQNKKELTKIVKIIDTVLKDYQYFVSK